MQEVPVTGWPRQFRRDARLWGPDRKDYCPCGSGRRAASCHSDRSGRWQIPPSVPLLTNACTGYSRPGCYAAASEDCSPKLSKEHWLSAGVLESAGNGQAVSVSGMPWLAGTERKLTTNSLGSNVLCERHNNALSPLDSLAGEVFRVVHHYQNDLAEPVDPHGDEFALFDGTQLERWAIKLFWGGVAAGALGHEGTRITSLRSTIDPKWLAEVLFRGEPLPEGWGLYVGGRIGVDFSGQAQVALQSHTGPDADLWAGVIEFGAIAFRLCFGTLAATNSDIVLNRHPQGVFVTTPTRDRQKILALSWDDEGNDPLILTRRADGTSTHTPSHW